MVLSFNSHIWIPFLLFLSSLMLKVQGADEKGPWRQKSDKDCWYSCASKGGACPSFCGPEGYCCRQGYGDCPSGAADASPRYHTCVTQTDLWWQKLGGKGFENCLEPCGGKGGACDSVCGPDALCCKEGSGECPPGAEEASPTMYTCVTQTGIKPRQQKIHDKGYGGCMAGWYDVQGQGAKNDYCRWVGNCGCRGSCSWWSCALAGTKVEKTDKGKYSEPGPEIFKNDYLAIKNDGSKEYKKAVQTWLPRLLEGGILKEGEVGVAFSVTDPKEKYPFGLLTGEDFITNKIPKQSIAINGTVNKYILKRSFGNLYRPTGLYATPGEFITVTIPEELVDKISVDIDHSDYFIRSKMKKTTQKVGSPWGGLILIYLNDGDATTKLGQFNVEIQNGVQAPYWVYGEDTNEKWNKTKNNASPWAVLRIPGQLAVYIQTAHVKPETDMEKVMKGWKETMDLLDDMMGIPVGIQPGEEQLHWHPYVGGGLRMGMCTGAARSAIGAYDYPHFLRDNCAVVYHEFGHGYCYSDLPGGDNPREGMGGQWTAEIIREYIERTKPGLPPISSRESKFGDPFNVLYRMVSFKKFSKGKPCGEVKFKNKKSSYWTDSYDNCWAYLYRLPLFEWGWNKLRAVLRADAPLTEHYDTKPDRLADIYCNVTKHNLIPLFKFYNIEISDSIVKRCEQLKEPSLITNYINIANCIMTKDINDCIDLPGFPSYEGICTINGVCNSSPDHEGVKRTMKNEFDLWGGTIDSRYKPGARSTSYNEKNCLKRAAEVHKWCGNDQSQLVTATFTPKDGTPKSATNIKKGNCYYDNPRYYGNARLLPKYKASRPNMVPEVCNSICREAEDSLEMYSYFGVQYYNECWCGHKAPPLSKKLDPEDCDTMCKGDEKLRCGGGYKANIWKICTDENCEFKYD